MMQIDVNGTTLVFDDVGSGPAVVLLHGWPDDRSMWRYQVPALVEAGFRVIAPDVRGFGESGKPEAVADYAIPTLAGDVIGLLDDRGVTRAHLVGHDWGAPLAWALAGFAPDRVDHLVALSVGHPAAFADAGMEQRRKSWYMLLFQFEGIAERWLSADDFHNLREFSHHPDIEAVVARLRREGALTASLNWYRANVPPETLVMRESLVPAVTVPTMGVWSAGDMALGEQQMIESGKHVDAEWRYERLGEGVSHWIPLDAPEALNALLLDFLPAPR